MAKTRLTKYARIEIVNSVMKSTTRLHAEREQIVLDIKQAVASAVRASRPEGFHDLVAHAPKEWFTLCAYVYWGKNPVWVMGVAIDATAQYESSIMFDDPIVTTPHSGVDMRKLEKEPEFVALVERAGKWADKYLTMRGQLATFLASCSTVEALAERMPELIKHIPKAQVSYPLVAPSNLLSVLLAEGFDPV